jgi:hypothetical protein
MDVDEHTISPAGDPFHAAPDDQDHPHACLNGCVYLGYTAVDEQTGEEVEWVEALPCRRCAEVARWVIGPGYPTGWLGPLPLEEEWTSISRHLTITKCRVG